MTDKHATMSAQGSARATTEIVVAGVSPAWDNESQPTRLPLQGTWGGRRSETAAIELQFSFISDPSRERQNRSRSAHLVFAYSRLRPWPAAHPRACILFPLWGSSKILTIFSA